MNNEEEFLNILRDCWVGREYRCAELIQVVLNDDGKVIKFRTVHVDQISKTRYTMREGTMTKKGFASLPEKYGYERIK